MSIKYHDNTVFPKYGPDHTLLDNWNPDADYGGEYARVHFRIRTPAYDTSSSFLTDGDRGRFYTEAGNVLRTLGWTPNAAGRDSICTTFRCGKAHLYLHPQDISGELLKREVRTVAEALEKNNTFFLSWVDVYETVYDITDEAYIRYLDGQVETIKTEILAAARTTRRNLFHFEDDVVRRVASRVRMKRVGEDDGRCGGAGKTADYIIGVISQLIDDGCLVTATARNKSRLIRTINKTEQRQKKIKIA